MLCAAGACSGAEKEEKAVRRVIATSVTSTPLTTSALLPLVKEILISNCYKNTENQEECEYDLSHGVRSAGAKAKALGRIGIKTSPDRYGWGKNHYFYHSSYYLPYIIHIFPNW